MITTGLILGGMTVGGFYILFHKLPHKVRNFFINRPLFTDAVAAIFTYALFSGTLLGLFAAAWAGLIVSFMLAARKNPVIMGYFEKAKQACISVFKWVENYGKDRLALDPEVIRKLQEEQQQQTATN